MMSNPKKCEVCGLPVGDYTKCVNYSVERGCEVTQIVMDGGRKHSRVMFAFAKKFMTVLRQEGITDIKFFTLVWGEYTLRATGQFFLLDGAQCVAEIMVTLAYGQFAFYVNVQKSTDGYMSHRTVSAPTSDISYAMDQLESILNDVI